MFLKRMLVSVCFIFGLILCPGVVFSESFQEFFDNFNIDEAKKDENFKLPANEFSLAPYFLCLAGARSDERMCDNLRGDARRNCYENFNRYYGFYSSLIYEQEVTPRNIAACDRASPKTGEQCKAWGEAFLSKDTTKCNNIKEFKEVKKCRAVLTQNPIHCVDDFCRDRVFYIKAIKEKNIGGCDRIEEERLKMLCKGGIAVDENVCKECSGFDTFIKGYYNETQIRGVTQGGEE